MIKPFAKHFKIHTSNY